MSDTKIRGVVLITHEAYKRLREQTCSESVHDDKTSETAPAESWPPKEVVTTAEFKDQSTHMEKNEESLEELSKVDQYPTSPQPEEPTQYDPTEVIAYKYRKRARDTLRQLETINGLNWSNGSVSLNGRPFGLSIESLLKVICVPFTKVTLKKDLLDTLISHRIPIRNHLVKQTDPLPPWHEFFSF